MAVTCVISIMYSTIDSSMVYYIYMQQVEDHQARWRTAHNYPPIIILLLFLLIMCSWYRLNE